MALGSSLALAFPTMTQRAAVLYARISVSTEESVSVQRQIASARKYASARGWRVVGEFIDDGVSATRNKPEQRPGWRSLLGSPVGFDAVVVWKVDRLARRVIDFLHADETLQARGAAIVCVEQSIDMTTGEGRAFAQMPAVFGGDGSFRNLLADHGGACAPDLQGRVARGLQPYGWLTVPHPDGPGRVRGQDPNGLSGCAGWRSGCFEETPIYSIQTWLNASGAPAPRARQPGRPWGYSSVDVLMRNPVLAGMFPINSRNAYGPDGPEVRRGEDGQPIVAADGIVTVEQYYAIVHAITHKAHHSARSKKSKRTTSPLLALLATCRTCDRVMYRCRNVGKPSLTCAHCGQMVDHAAPR